MFARFQQLSLQEIGTLNVRVPRTSAGALAVQECPVEYTPSAEMQRCNAESVHTPSEQVSQAQAEMGSDGLVDAALPEMGSVFADGRNQIDGSY